MIYRTIGIILLGIFSVACGWAQSFSSVKLGVDTVTVGDPFDVQLLVKIEGDKTGVLDFSAWNQIPNILYENDTVNFSPYADYAIVDGGKIQVSEQKKVFNLSQIFNQNNGINTFQDNFRMAIYDVGIFEIPGPSIVEGNNALIPTEPARMVVILPPEIQRALQDSVAIAPIKPILEEPMTLEDFKYVFIIIGFLILFSALYYFLVVKKKRELPEPIVIETYVPPHMIALEKLGNLKEKQLWERGLIKEYQSELTYVIREYLEKRFDFNALEMTTGEIIRRVPKVVNKEELQKILQIADLVKFAKANPPEDLHSQFLDLAIKLVNETKAKEVTEDD